MDMLHRSIAKLTRLCVNQDARIATIRATLVATLLASVLLILMNLSSSAHASIPANKAAAERDSDSLDS